MKIDTAMFYKKGYIMEKRNFKINIHLVLALAIILFLVLVITRILNFGNKITQEDMDAISVPDNAAEENYDEIMPLMAEDDGTFPEDDQVTTVLCFGNQPFSDDRNSADSLCSLFKAQTGATVYNCSVPGSYMAVRGSYDPDSYSMDAFSFYYMALLFAKGDDSYAEQIFSEYEVSQEIKDAVELLKSIDARTIDAVFIMYDGSDYLDSSAAFNDDYLADPICYTGGLAAGIQTIQESCPWIRIIVMAPTYAFAIGEDGSYVSSDIQKNAMGCKMSIYILKQAETSSLLSVSFVDTFYGGIHEDIASDYLIDNLHLNLAGRQLVANRMQQALEKYTTIY